MKLLLKTLLTLFIFALSLCQVYAQEFYSLASRSFINDISPYGQNDNTYKLPSAIREKYAVYTFGGVDYVSGLVQLSDNNAIKSLEILGCYIGSSAGNVVSVRVPLSSLNELRDVKGIAYLELGRKIKPTLKDAVADTRADSVHAGIQLPQGYTGKGVVVGVTDWGFDYTHPTFYDTSLTNLRIVKAWDQFKNSGPAPSPFGYGTEYTTTQELLAAEHDTSNIYGIHTHGTHVSGISAGSGAGTPFKGFAPDAELVFVTILPDEASVLDAFTYIYNYAQSAGKPLVVNMSWGLYYIGTLDGSSLISQSLDYLASQGVHFVSSAGNNGDVNFHIKKDFISGDTLRTGVAFEPYSLIPTMWGQSLSLWGTPACPFAYGLDVYDASNNLIQSLPYYNTADAIMLDTVVTIGADTIEYKIESEAVNPHNQRPGVRFRVRNLKTSLYRIVLKVAADTGTVHMWNVIELVNDVGNWGAAFEATLPSFTAGDNNYAIGEPACAAGVTAVASYRSEVTLPNGNTYYGNISYFSSKGPLMTGVVKPDIAGPGHSVGSSLSYFYNGNPISSIANVDFGGRTYKFGRMSGTSMSSPAVAGIVALLLEVNPSLTPSQMKDLLKQTVRTDTYTGVIPPTGDVLWGWGKVNAYHAARQAAGMAGTTIPYKNIVKMNVYPNPTSGFLNIEAPEDTYSLSLTDMAGRTVFQRNNVCINGTYLLSISPIRRGHYILLLNSSDRSFTSRIVLD